MESKAIGFEGVQGRCYILGRMDALMAFSDGTYGIIDFKTSDPKDEHVQLYGRQLQACAYALENPSRGEGREVSRLGLLCVEPQEMVGEEGFFFYAGRHWIPVERTDGDFMAFLQEIAEILSKPPPPPSADCQWCVYALVRSQE